MKKLLESKYAWLFLTLFVGMLWAAASKTDMTLGTSPGNPSAGKIRLYGDSGTGKFTCLNSSGASCLSATATSQAALGSIPGTCTTNDLFFATDSPYTARCSATNTWTYFLPGLGNYNPMATGSYTSFNLSSTTVTNNGGMINFFSTENADALHGYCTSAPGTPFTVTIPISYQYENGAHYPFVFVGFSDGTKYEVAVALNQGSSGLGPDTLELWNTATSRSGLAGTNRAYMVENTKALRVTDNGTNKIFSASIDGVNFTTTVTETRTTFLTPSQYCFGLRTYGGGAFAATASTLGILVN